MGIMTVPTAAADSMLLANVEMTRVTFTARGAVKVTMRYLCPSGYAPPRAVDAYASLEQFADGLTLLQRFKRAPAVSFTCDDTRNELQVKFRNAASGEFFHPDVPLFVGAGLFLTNSDRQVVSAGERETHLRAETPAYIEIRGFDLARTGAARVTAAYRCPKGYQVDVAIAVVSPPGDSGKDIKDFKNKVDCDGSPNELSVRVQTTTSVGEPIEPEMRYVVTLIIDPIWRSSIRASDEETLILHAS